MASKHWKRSFAFRLREEDEMISRFISSSNKSDSDTIRELLRFAISEINKKKQERQLDKNYKQIEAKLLELLHLQEQNHREIIELLQNGMIVDKVDQDNNRSDDTNSSIESSIDSVFDMFNMND